MIRKRRMAALSLALVASCALGRDRGADDSGEAKDFSAWRLSGGSQDTPLYSRDGGVVDGPGAGTITEGVDGHAPEPAPNGRMYILELYQKAIEERDGLQLEVSALSATLESLQAELHQAEQGIEQRDQRIQQLESERDAALEQNGELSGRLVTAQIRRLEAEKLLLESKLEWQRALQGEHGLPRATGVRPMSVPASGPAGTDSP